VLTIAVPVLVPEVAPGSSPVLVGPPVVGAVLSPPVLPTPALDPGGGPPHTPSSQRRLGPQSSSPTHG
jgi:hypothetical protein